MRSDSAEVGSALGSGLHQAPFPVSLWVLADDGVFRIADVNEAGCEFSGLTREQLIGADAAEVGGNPARATRDMRRALGSEGTVTRELPRVMPDGEVRDLKVVYVARDPRAVLAFVVDLTSQRHAEERLRVAENRYRTLVSAANEGVWLVDSSGRTSFANAKVGTMLGRPLAQIAQSNLLDFVHPPDRAAVAGAIECPRDTPAAFEARFLDADDRELLCLMSVSPVPGDGSAPATLCLLADMTEVQRERELRRATEQRFRWIVETAGEGIWTGDSDGRTTFVNDAAARMLGLDHDEIRGRHFTELVVFGDDAAQVRERLRRTGKPARHQFGVRRPDGRQLDVEANLSLLRDDSGAVIGSMAMLSDVTQQKAEHAELRESRERFAQVFEEAPVGMAFIGAGHLVRGRFLGANRAFRELLGYSDDELRQRDILSVTHPHDAERERVLADELFENERAEYAIEKRFVRSDGSFAWARFRAHVLRDERGAPLYALGLAVDIGAEKEAAYATATAAARATALLGVTPDAVVEIDSDGCITEINGAALRMFGLERSEMAGKPLTEVLVPARLRGHFAQAFDEWTQAVRDGRAVEPRGLTLMRADASEFPVEARIGPVLAGESPRLMIYLRNLALQERADAARRDAEERFERLFRDGVATAAIDLEGRLAEVNAAFCRLAARDAVALIGRDAGEVLANGDATQDPPWRSADDRQGPVTAPRQIVRPDGHAVPVETTLSLVRDAADAPSHWLCQCTPKQLAGADALPHSDPLSYRERQVLGLLAQGHDGPAIAERLGLSPETVRSYAQTAREKLGADTRTHAVALALVRGEISI